MTDLLRYDIRNSDVAQDLLAQGFTVYNTSPGIWTLEAPTDISATKARKLISICIKLYEASKEYSRAKKKYESLVNKINQFNKSRLK